MKNIIKLSSLLIGFTLSAISPVVSAKTVGEITIAGNAHLTSNQLRFADNSVILNSSFFSGGVDFDGNLLPDLKLKGLVIINPIDLSPLGTVANGLPIATISPLITGSINFYPTNPGTDGSNFIAGEQQFTGVTFDGIWKTTVSEGTYRFPGQISLSAQGVPGAQSFSMSGIAFEPVKFIPDEFEVIPEPSGILSAFLILGIMPLLRTVYTKKA
jgi:hypothetical protein